jgi:cell division protein FtsW
VARRRPADEVSAAFRSRRDDDQAVRRARSTRKRQPVTDAGRRNAAYLTATVAGLTLFGLVMVLSASSVASLHQYGDSSLAQFQKQATWAGIGTIAFLIASRVDYRLLRPVAKPLLLISVAMLVAVLVPGVGRTVNGSSRWLGLGSVVIQPGEVAKLVAIVFFADLLAARERRMDRPELTVRPVMLTLGLISALVVVQPKLGTPMIMGAVTLIMLFVAGAKVRHLAPWVMAAVGLSTVAAYFETYRRDRLFAYLDPWEDPLGAGLQSIQSQVGIASGGLFGLGLGASRAKWGFLPYPYTDFIFAIVAEEVGLIGASALICGFLFIGWFGLKAAMYAPDRFGTLLAAGLTCWLLVQAFLNIGMVVGVLPITGEPLPFVSAGGSSLVTTLAAAGLLASVSRRARV